MSKPLKLVITPAASAALSSEEICLALQLHNVGDWGLDYEAYTNLYDAVLQSDVRFFSSFRDKNYKEYWVMTKKDNTITVLLPKDYCPNWRDPVQIEAEEDNQENL